MLSAFLPAVFMGLPSWRNGSASGKPPAWGIFGLVRRRPLVLEWSSLNKGARMRGAMMIGTRLLAALGALALAGHAASAQIDAGKLAAAKAAAASFATLAKDSEKTGNAPRESDPAVRRLLEAVFDSRDVEATRNVTFAQLGPLSERMINSVQVGLIYMLAGTGAKDLPQMANDPKADEKVNLNIIKFAPEMGRFFDFQMRIQGAVVDGTLVHLASAKPEELARPNVQSGLANIRQGSARTVAGAIETLAVNGLTDEWRRARMPGISSMGPRLAKFLPADQKAELQKLALACADVVDDPEAKKALQAFAATIGG
jgi:hypothetical protein